MFARGRSVVVVFFRAVAFEVGDFEEAFDTAGEFAAQAAFLARADVVGRGGVLLWRLDALGFGAGDVCGPFG